jgi:hypothetical protein
MKKLETKHHGFELRPPYITCNCLATGPSKLMQIDPHKPVHVKIPVEGTNLPNQEK